MYDDELYHYGVKGMKWGVRRARKNVESFRKKITKRKKAFDSKRAKKQAKKEQMTKEEFEANKKKAIESGSAEEVLKYRGHMTNQELRTAVDRLDLERRIKGHMPEDINDAKSFIEKTSDKIDKVTRAIDNTTKLYNSVAKINNSINPDLELPILDGKTKSEKAKEKAKKERDKKVDEMIKKADIDKIIKNLDELTADEQAKVVKVLKNRQKIKKYKDDPNADLGKED